MQEMKEINELALRALQKGDFDEAQRLFYSNAKKFPNHKTFNNLAMFCLSCGMRQKNGRVVSAQKLGMEYLKKALVFKRSCLILSNLGIEIFNLGKFDEAYCKFIEANSKGNSNISIYNMAVCKYMSKEYSDILWNVDALCNETFCKEISDNGGSDPRLLCFFSAMYSGNTDYCKNMITTIEEVNEEFAIYDKFCALCLTNEYDMAYKLVNLLIKDWDLDYSVIAMIANCCTVVEPSHINDTCIQICESSTLSKSKIKRIFNDSFTRGKLLNDYVFVPTIALHERWYL